jgi:flagellar hook-length control protein FliK
MQATLAARSKLIDAVAPRPTAARGDQSMARQSARHDPFATQLADARDRTTRRADHADSSKQAAVEPTREVKATERARTDRRDPSHEADNGKGEDSSTEATAAKAKPAAKPAAKPEPGASEEEVPAETVAEVKKPLEPSKNSVAADAVVATGAVQLSVPHADDATSSGHLDKGDSSVDAAAALAIAAQSSPTAADLVGEADAAESDGATSQDAALKILPADPEAKPAKSQSATSNAQAEAMKPDSTVVAATTNGASGREHDAKDGNTQQQQPEDDATASAGAANLPEAASLEKKKASAESTFDELLAKLAPQDAAAPKQAVDRPLAAPTPAPPEQKFAADNVDNVVKSVRTQVEAGGGQMRMRLDPPELGALDVAVKMVDGRMTASFTTSNDHATQLLSHSLNDLKQSLEASGITVDRIQVRQTSSDNNAQQQPGDHRRDGQSGAFDQPSSRGDQQRKDAVEKMWRKLAYGSDELDFVA